MARLANIRRQLAVFFLILGPGFITAMVDNDAGGIFTYSEAGARYGYATLWTLIPITLALIVAQEMCSRMGAVTGKGLSDLIREEFGFRTTFLLMAALVLVNFANVAANFAGVAESLRLFGVSPLVSVPAAGAFVWLLVVKGSYDSVEKVFLVASTFYLAYVVAAVMAKPDWSRALEATVTPTWVPESAYLILLVGLVGTSVAPWMQFYLQAAIVEKGIDEKQYRDSRIEVILGCVVMSIIAFFIILSSAGAIWEQSPRAIETSAEAALALRPLGEYAYILFAGGLLCASLFASSILPLSTAYTVCEGLGFESGVNREYKDARVFYGLYTGLIVVGGGIVLIPGFPLVRLILVSQVLNGILLPVILIFTLMLINRKDLMREWTNSGLYNLVAYGTAGVMILLSLALAWFSL